jgi:hypothetical protein
MVSQVVDDVEWEALPTAAAMARRDRQVVDEPLRRKGAVGKPAG